jgi:hypothetical protein
MVMETGALGCTQCQRLLAPDEPVWRAYVRHGPTSLGIYPYWLQAFCADCHDPDRSYAQRSCPRCGRPVHDELRGRYARARRRPFCCLRCSSAYYNHQHRQPARARDDAAPNNI